MNSDNPICPSCGKKLKYGMLRCDACNMAIGTKAAGIRLSDKELSEKLLALRKKQTMFILIGLIPLSAAILVLIYRMSNIDFGMIFLAPLYVTLMLAAVVLFIMAWITRGKMKQLISLNTVQAVLNEVFELQEYIYNEHMDEKIIAATQLVPGWNSLKGSDYVSGKYQGVRLMFSDIHMEQVTVDSDNHKSSTTILKGQWIACELGKESGIHMLIRERSKKKLARGREKTNYELMTVNAAFNERFQVIATDPDLALRFLTPHTIEHIVSIATTANARVYLYIGGMWLHVAVDSGKNFFEVGKSTELSDIPQLRTRLKSELKYITNIIDKLLRIEYLFGKQ